MLRDGGLRQLFQAHIRDCHWQPVETWSTGQGVPDAEYCIDGVSGWIEFKLASTSRIDHGPTPEQIAWALRRLRNGGRVFVAVRHRYGGGPRRGPAVDELLLFDGGVAELLRDRGIIGVPALGRWSAGPASWDWPEVRRLLARRA